MVETLHEPLMHMIRNSVDHGIEAPEARMLEGKPERAVINLEARQQGNTVKVIISDDGRGIDINQVGIKALEKGLITENELANKSPEEIIKFIFLPGFSTASQVTETSGRGVGMDVVKTNVTRCGGTIDVTTVLGRGTRFVLELPLSAAIQDTLLVQVNKQTMAIPERYITEMIEVKRGQFQLVNGCHAVVIRDCFLPVYRLGALLGIQKNDIEEMDNVTIVVLSDGVVRMGIIVDSSRQRQELFIKDINEQLTSLPGLSGAAILGDGKVVLILDVEDLFKLAMKQAKVISVNQSGSSTKKNENKAA